MPLFARPKLTTAVRLAVATAMLCALFAFGAASADAAPWGAPEEVSPVVGNSTTTQVGIDGAGDATAIWTTDEGPNQQVMTARRPAGSGWEAPELIDGTIGTIEGPLALAENEAGAVVAAWTERLGGSAAVFASVRPAGGYWGPIEAFATGGESAEAPAVAIDPAGDVAIAWRQQIGGTAVIEGSSLPAGSFVWAAPTPLSSVAEDSEAVSITISAAGTATAVWFSSDGSLTWISAASLQVGGTWTLEGEISQPAPATEPPQVEVDAAGEFFAIWSRAGAGRVTEVARRAPGGTWGHSVPISSNGPIATSPRIAVGPAGNAVAVWCSIEGSEEAIEASRLAVGSTSWGAPQRVSDLGAEVEAPSVAIGPAGIAEVAWSGWNGATHNYESHAAHLGPRGIWRAAVAISRLGEEALRPHVRISRGGHAIIVWQGYVEVSVVIRSVTTEETAPLAVTKSGDGSGTVTSEPAGILCGATCTARFLEGETVTLSAAPAAGSRFAGWSGACSGTGPCEVEIDETQSVGAEFVPVSTGGGSGGSGTTATASVTSRQPAQGASCTPITAASVSGFVPTPKPGHVVPGVRAKVTVKHPSAVQVSAMLGFGSGSQVRLVDLGSVSYHAASARNLRFAVPAKLRSRLPLGSTARLILSISAKPDSSKACATPSTVKRGLKVKVVKVLSGSQAGVS